MRFFGIVWRSRMSIVKQLLKYYLFIAILFSVSRLSLFALYFDTFKDSGVNYWLIFPYGLRMDSIVISILLIIPALLLTLSPRKIQKPVSIFLKYYFLLVISSLIYIEIATFPFIAEYDVRPNYLFVEYLRYPKEVAATIFAAYKFELSIAFLSISSFIVLFLKKAKDDLKPVFSTSYIRRVSVLVPILLILVMGIRSSFGHRPANISDAMYSSNRMINEITKNSLYSIGYAVYVNARNGSKKLMKQYGRMEIGEAIGRVEARLNIASIDKLHPLARMRKTHFPTEKPKNLVIFLQESLGYQFVEAVGGEAGITPYFNRLAEQGILFRDLYSNGTRSVRGIAGMVSGNFSIPGKGVVKRNRSQKDYFTIAKLLKPYGYHTSFIYGGESRFDNMKGWFSGNGFDEIIDQSKFPDPAFVGTWGVCDGEVVARAHEEFKQLYSRGEKFASVIFSTSNHTPFDFPEDKIEWVEGVPRKSVKNAVKYADYAIGQLLELAKREAYYADTVFVVVADHNIRVYGVDMVPVDMFHIPALILGGGIEPLVYNGIATQPDVLATALDLLGIDFTFPVMGHSIFSDKKVNMALMQFHSSYALRQDDKVAVLRPKKKPLTFYYKDKHLVAAEHDRALEEDLRAFIVTLNHLYSNKLYR